MASTYTDRDRTITRATHALFWRATMVDYRSFIVWTFTRPPALLISNVIIPFQVAFDLQAIITRQFDDVGTHDELLQKSGIYAKLWQYQSGGYIITEGTI